MDVRNGNGTLICYNYSMLTRRKHTLPSDIKSRLESQGLMGDYKARPAYQQNDYIGWITSAKLPATREKRLTQMFDELRVGGVYMKMKHPPSVKQKKA